jgi:hypothetical protein
MRPTITTTLRLVDRTVPITIAPSVNGGCEWEPITIDGIDASHWLEMHDDELSEATQKDNYE